MHLSFATFVLHAPWWLRRGKQFRVVNNSKVHNRYHKNTSLVPSCSCDIQFTSLQSSVLDPFSYQLLVNAFVSHVALLCKFLTKDSNIVLVPIVKRRATVWKNGVRFPVVTRNFFLYSTASRSALGPTQHPTQLILGTLSAEWGSRNAKLTTYLYLVPRSRIVEL
jgi:hypothetical protein